jgi:polyamine oxidase
MWSALLSVALAASVVQTDVIIIGAGISGAGAAEILSSKGINYVILEAQNLIGGRMKNGIIGGREVELGCNWIQGVGGDQINPIRAIADKIGLKTVRSNDENAFVFKADGTKDTSNKEAEMLKLRDELTAIALNSSDADLSIAQNLKNLGYVAQDYLDRFYEFLLLEEELAADIYSLATRNLEQSTFSDFGEGNDLVFDKRGYKAVAEKVFEDAGAKEKIRLNERVTRIRYTTSGVNVATASGNQYYGKYLISTIPLGALQKSTVKFTPPLPQAKLRAINNFGMGTYTKIFANYPAKFWGDEEFMFYANDTVKGMHPEHINLMAANHIPENEVNGNLQLHVFSGKLGEVETRKSKNEISNGITNVMKNVYQKDVVEPTELLFHAWKDDPLFGGSYSFWPAGYTERDFEDLQANVGRVFFGGEMTSRKYNGYVHGGYLAGIDVANNVAACMLDKCPENMPTLSSSIHKRQNKVNAGNDAPKTIPRGGIKLKMH